MKLRILAAITLIACALTTHAEMYVDRSIVIFEPGGQPRQDVKVSNTGMEVMYINVEVLRVTDPGTPEEKREPVDNPQELKLLATPNKLIIPPGAQKLIRIVNLQASNDDERVYRINVRPVVAPLSEEESQLRIVVAYQILAIVQPNAPQSQLSAVREGNRITFSNAGNTNVLLSDGVQCKPGAAPEDEEGCEELASRRLYAGNTWTQELRWDAPVSYSVRTYDGIRKEIFP